MGSSFREFDIYSFRDGTLGDKPNELASGLHEIVNLDPANPPLGQQASFLAQNLIVRDTVPQAAISELINKSGPERVQHARRLHRSGWGTSINADPQMQCTP